MEDEGAVKQMTSIYTLKAESGKSYDILLKYRHFDKTANLSFDMGVNAQIDVKGLLERIKDVDVVIFAVVSLWHWKEKKCLWMQLVSGEEIAPKSSCRLYSDVLLRL